MSAASTPTALGRWSACTYPGSLVRFDTYLVVGSQVTPYYDSLLGKLIILCQNTGKKREKNEGRPYASF